MRTLARVGERVGVLRDANPEVVHLFGYGVYACDEVPTEDVDGCMGRLGLFGVKNPKMVLDDGTVVWGCESWWGPEAKVKASIGDRKVEIVKPTRTAPTDKERQEAVELKAYWEADAARIVDEIKENLAKEKQ